MICPDFVDLDEFYLLRKNNVGSMGNKHISYRQSVSIREFFIVFGYCGIEEILNAVYLPLLFSIILQLLTSSIYSEKMMLVLWEINTYHTDKVSVYVSFS